MQNITTARRYDVTSAAMMEALAETEERAKKRGKTRASSTLTRQPTVPRGRKPSATVTSASLAGASSTIVTKGGPKVTKAVAAKTTSVAPPSTKVGCLRERRVRKAPVATESDEPPKKRGRKKASIQISDGGVGAGIEDIKVVVKIYPK